MSKFLQMHILVAYPPSNLNRDDLGRPKTAVLGGTQRLRVSSQSLKRAWRTSTVFADEVGDTIGIRTKEMGNKIYEALITGKSLYTLVYGAGTDERSMLVNEKDAAEWAMSIASIFGKLQADKKTIEQLAHYSEEEIRKLDSLLRTIASRSSAPQKEELDSLLTKNNTSADIAMFGRMLASSPANNVEAAVQVAHAITVHRVAVEDDYFTAVDDLNHGEEDLGAGHLGQIEFASGLFYLYTCVDTELLRDNLGGDTKTAISALRALVSSAACVPPKGKQNSFASRAYASYMLVEEGSQQPRSLAVSFLRHVNDDDVLGTAINKLKHTRDSLDKVYGRCYENTIEYDVQAGTGTLEDVYKFVGSVYGGT